MLPPSSVPTAGPISVGERLRAELRLKIVVLLGLAVGICAPYFGLHALDPVPVWAPPVTALDHAIGFQPGWIYAYLSVGFLVPLFPMLATRRSELLGFARGLAVLCVASFLVFAALPVAGPRPELGGTGAAYRWLIGIDASTNAFPSLHAALAVYCLAFGWRLLAGGLSRRGSAGLAAALLAWGGAILYATLATKQHWAWDLAPGIALAGLGYSLAWRDALPSRPRMEETP